jgi:hypothetical protein
MQQHDFDALIYEEEQILNKWEREEVILRYKSTSPPYYWQDHENEKFEQKLRILNLQFVMWLNKKPQFRVSKCLEEWS